MRHALTSPLVIFDLDGTLVDTAPDLIDSLNYAIAASGLAPTTYGDLKHLVGHGARVMIKRAFALRNKELSDDDLEPLYERFLSHYLDQMPGQSVPYPGIVAALERLSAAGFTLAVCTNKTTVLTIPLLEKLGLSHHFAAVTCGDTFEWRKPDARHITGTIEKAGGDPAKSVMVGDSFNDIASAKNANIPSVGVTFGYTDVPMAELGPDVVIDSYDELDATLIEKLISKRVAAA
ncbi:phosphoglycolate phosphatase [Agrobacterium rubi]|uniref:Phosphoglycolate phosphatase n=1 Tax=Agrobacterium rubi TaxID=28099 RepID=A0AAE7R3S7_9HYPH|nr:phosphoglycolate phosphatase [Agrobacterium rubi]NTE86516.1 phosphoglycolate phosphatase [Agrobacterium rubi]NTF02448.1 phosphoglycolate phosphatase [Agrobacterium rubi]NTF36693.1 phosphoglycolate phosphatase [Agrobacterium rubi]OCJ55677.1 phosphoglycolate phosphatase, bacterial [Agrobacterium rubi]QTF99146.1 phosphoglycolate phosphatase [Agrobacterium rubi]